MTGLFGTKRWIVLTGNYGSGKTEIALNLAFGYTTAGQQPTLVDLDIVNPYFRSGEKAQELKEAGIRVLMPTFALTTVDIPALPPEIQSVFDTPSDRVIFDVGGDDTGAAALGRYHHSFDARKDQTLVAMVVNTMRPLTCTEPDVLDLAMRIQAKSMMRISMLLSLIFEGVMGWIRPAVVGLIGAAGIILMFKVAWSGTPLLSGFDFSVVKENFPHWSSWLLFAAAVIASLFFKVGPIPVIIAGGILGLLIY